MANKTKNWGMGKDERSRTRPGEKDYTGHKGDKSKTDKGREDYTWRKAREEKLKKARAQWAKAINEYGAPPTPQELGKKVGTGRRKPSTGKGADEPKFVVSDIPDPKLIKKKAALLRDAARSRVR